MYTMFINFERVKPFLLQMKHASSSWWQTNKISLAIILMNMLHDKFSCSHSGGETADKQFQKGDIFKCLNMDTRKVLNITPHSKCCQLCHHMENYNLIHKEVTSSIYMYKLHIC